MKMIVDYLYQQLDSPQYDKEILLYGLKVLIYNFFTLFLMFTIGFLMNEVAFALIFVPIFALLRIFIGGYHSKTIINCTCLMATIYISVNIIKNLTIYQLLLPYISVILIIYLFFIRQTKENTIHLNSFELQFKYLLIVFFSACYFMLQNSIYFIPVFSALLVVELMYIAKKIKDLKQKA